MDTMIFPWRYESIERVKLNEKKEKIVIEDNANKEALKKNEALLDQKSKKRQDGTIPGFSIAVSVGCEIFFLICMASGGFFGIVVGLIIGIPISIGIGKFVMYIWKWVEKQKTKKNRQDMNRAGAKASVALNAQVGEFEEALKKNVDAYTAEFNKNLIPMADRMKDDAMIVRLGELLSKNFIKNIEAGDRTTVNSCITVGKETASMDNITVSFGEQGWQKLPNDLAQAALAQALIEEIKMQVTMNFPVDKLGRTTMCSGSLGIDGENVKAYISYNVAPVSKDRGNF